jgi:hypothetical protein
MKQGAQVNFFENVEVAHWMILPRRRAETAIWRSGTDSLLRVNMRSLAHQPYTNQLSANLRDRKQRINPLADGAKTEETCSGYRKVTHR